MSAETPGGRRSDSQQNIAAAITDISERATLLVREEIELAKTEVTEKFTKLAKGAVVGVAAGVFFLTALFFLLIGCAWLLYFYLPVNDFAYFWGFFAMAAILVVLGVIAGLIAAKVVKRGAPPVPTMAIEEAQRIREAVSSPPTPPPYSPPAAAAAAAAEGAPVPVPPPPAYPEAAPEVVVTAATTEVATAEAAPGASAPATAYEPSPEGTLAADAIFRRPPEEGEA
jgi:uncharacterized membrane protein YqjE